MRTFILLFLILGFSSCAKNPVEEVNEAIDIALTYLSQQECDEALKVLEEAGPQNDNAIYLQVLASAHACKASFDEINFVSTDLAAINTTSGNTILTSLSIMSLSDEIIADSASYSSIKNGINIILNSTTGSPSQMARSSKFGIRKSGDMGVQALLINVVNLGKFLNYYGNVGATGIKGAGSAPNKCFINYNDPRAQAVTGAGTGACVSDTDGHADLNQSTVIGKRRLCEGLMLVTNTLDILDNLDLSASPTLNKLEDISTKINAFRTNAIAAGLGTLISMTSQTTCEAHLTVPAQLLDMEYLYALIFETGLQ